MNRRYAKIAQLCLSIGVLFAMSSCGDFSSESPESHATRLLPEAPRQWRASGADKIFWGLALSDYINGGSEAYYAYGFREVAVREFENDAGARLTVEVYEMSKPENAFGIFSTDSVGGRWPIGAGASYGHGLLRFWKGRFFVRIMCYPPDESIEAVIRNLGARIADAIRDESRKPELFLSLVPETGAAPNSVCYFHRQTSLNNIRFISDDNLLHLGDDVDAITWEEQPPGAAQGIGAELRQIALRYPTDSDAEAALSDFGGKYLGLGPDASAASAAPLVAQLADAKYAAAGLRAPWLVVVLDAPSADAAGAAAGRTLEKLNAMGGSEGAI